MNDAGAAATAEPVLDTTHFDTVRFPPPAWALEEFARAARDGSLAYTPYRGNAAVLAGLAGPLGSLLGREIDPERELVLTPGTQAGLFATLAALAPGATRVVLPDPEYLFTARMLGLLRVPAERIPLTPAPERLLDLGALEAALAPGGALLVLSNPNNPTGAVYPAEHVAAIGRIASEHGATVVVDELYARLTYGAPVTHLCALPGVERCVTLLGPSKTESLSGYRIGVVLAPPTVADRIETTLSLLSLRAPAYAQHVLRRWLREDAGWLDARVAELRSLRDLTVSALGAMNGVNVESPAGTAYVFPDLRAISDDDEALARHLEEHARVRVTPGSHFGPRGAGHIRACYARDEREWERALARIGAALEAFR